MTYPTPRSPRFPHTLRCLSGIVLVAAVLNWSAADPARVPERERPAAVASTALRAGPDGITIPITPPRPASSPRASRPEIASAVRLAAPTAGPSSAPVEVVPPKRLATAAADFERPRVRSASRPLAISGIAAPGASAAPPLAVPVDRTALAPTTAPVPATIKVESLVRAAVSHTTLPALPAAPPPAKLISAGVAAAPLSSRFVPAFVDTLGDGTPTSTSVPALLGATTFYDAGFTGTRALAANIGLGHPWNGHETLNWLTAANYFSGPGALTPPNSFMGHETAVSHVMVGKGPTDVQRGVAFGIANGNFFAGNFITDASFNTTYTALWQTYQQALVTGINGPGGPVVDVVNSSFGDPSDKTGAHSGDVSRLFDALVYLANQTHGATQVFAAGNNGPAPNTINGPASGYNGLAVGALGGVVGSPSGPSRFIDVTLSSSRGPQDFFLPNNPTPPTDNAANGTLLPGVRARIDLTAPGEDLYLAFTATVPNGYFRVEGTSFAAPTVAGGVALLADYARATFPLPADLGAALDGRVVKSVLLNSADKTAGWTNGQTWNGTTWSTTQSLDFDTGAGRLNLDQVFRQYAAAGVTQLRAAGATNTVGTTGWAKGTLDRPVATSAATNDFYLDTPLTKYTELNTTLSWFVNRSIDTTTGATAEVGFHHLDLEVWLVDGVGGNLVQKVGSATAPYITSEHLSFLIPQDGFYLIRVVRPASAGATDPGTIYSFAGDTTTDPYGLAWLSRANVLATSGTTTNPTSPAVTPNALVAPDAGQTATLTYSGGTTNVTFPNAIYVGGSDQGAGGTGTFNVQSGATVLANNRVRVYGAGTVNVSDATLAGGLLEVLSGGSVVGSGTATLQFTTINTAGSITASAGGTLTLTPIYSPSGVLRSTINLTGPASLGGDGTFPVPVPVAGPGSLNKIGTGTLTLSQPNTYTGGTKVSAGTLLVTNTTGSGTGTGSVDVQSGGTLGGTGFITGNVTIGAGATVSPGLSPGVLTVGPTTFAGGGNYNWQVFDAAGAPGTGYDELSVTGPLTVTATGASPFNVNLWSLSAVNPDVNGDARNFNNTMAMSWTLVHTTAGVTGFDPTAFLIHVAAFNGTGGFTNALNGGLFRVGLAGNDLVLQFQPTPEPAHILAVVFALPAVAWLRRRVRRPVVR
jgi:autotransporter-associated beta strand protein